MLSKRFISVLAGLLLSSVANAADGKAPEDSLFSQLNNDNFDSFIQDNRVVVAEFYAPWCVHSQKIIDRLVAASENLEVQDVTFAQVDCVAHKDLCERFDIDVYPTMKVFKNHNLTDFVNFTGPTSINAITATILMLDPAPVKIVQSEPVLQNLLEKSDKPVVVDNSNGFNKTFYEIAEEHKDAFTFVSYNKTEESNFIVYVNRNLAENVQPEIVEIVNRDSIEKFINDKDSFIRWVKKETLPTYGLLTSSNYATYVDVGIPLAYYMYNNETDAKENIPFFKELGDKYRGKISFVGLDGTKFDLPRKNLELKEQYPLFAIHDISKNRKYPLAQMDQDEYEKLTEPLQLDKDAITSLVEQFVNKTAIPILRSEEVPTQDSVIYKLVGSTHDQIVLDEEKDVLVMYYAPWCNISSSLAPLFERTAKILYEDESIKQKLLVAKIDSFNNDVISIDIEGFPTVALFPAGKDAKPIIHTGGKSIESLMAFVSEHSKNQINGKEIFENYKNRILAQQAEEKRQEEKQQQIVEEEQKRVEEAQRKIAEEEQKTREEEAKIKFAEAQKQENAVHDEL